MSKFVKLTLALMFVVSFSIVGCLGDDDNPTGSSGSVVGKWLLTSQTINGTPMEEIWEYYLVFEEDSTGERLDMDDNLLSDFTWSIDGDKMTFSYTNRDPETKDFSVTSTTLTIETVYNHGEEPEIFVDTFTRQ